MSIFWLIISRAVKVYIKQISRLELCDDGKSNQIDNKIIIEENVIPEGPRKTDIRIMDVF